MSTAEQAELDQRLREAAEKGDTDAVSAALADGANLETRDGSQRTALLLAVTGDHLGAVRALVAAGADVNAVDDRSDTPWLVTGVTGGVEVMEALLPGDPDLKLRNRFGGIVLQPACERGHAGYVAAVLEQTDIDIDQVNDIGWTGLLEAIILGDGSKPYQEIVATLIAHDVDVNLADAEGVRPLRHARRRGQDRVAQLLTDAGAKT